MSVVAGVEILMPLKGLIDDIEESQKHVESSKKKLSNKSFVDKVPEDVVAAVRATLLEREIQLRKLQELLDSL